jgi:hypothetical protein
VLDANPEILDAFHDDLKKLSGGRRGRATTPPRTSCGP